VPTLFFRSLLLLALLLSGSLATAAEKRELSVDPQILAQAKQIDGRNPAALRALFGLSQREDLRETRSLTDRNGATHSRYRQTLQGIPVWAEEIVISRNPSGGILSLHGTLVTGLGDDLPQVRVSLTAADALNGMKERVRNGHPQTNDLRFENESSELVVYLDGTTPTIGYSVSFFADTETGGTPTRPYFIVDAVSGGVLFQYEGLTHKKPGPPRPPPSALPFDAFIGSASAWEWNYYEVEVIEGQDALYVTTSGADPDADLYVRFGSDPTRSSYDCGSFSPTSNESCVVSSPAAGTWHIGIYAWSNYTNLSVSAKAFNGYDGGTGPGGNVKTGQYLTSFQVLKDGTTCILSGPNVTTINLDHSTSGSSAFEYTEEPDGPCYNSHKPINGAYAPLNDAHYFGQVVYDMYGAYVGVPPLTFQLTMRVHYSTMYENAFWNGSSMTFGDGYTTFYPLVSLDVSAHEVSHGFTEQNSGLVYSGQSGGINEAFSDMAGEAAEFYLWGNNDWLVGADIFKADDGALRYMCDPTRDGQSIDNAGAYYSGLDVHYSSGVFNKAFCTLAMTPGWNTQTAFEAFARANRVYWTPSTTFSSGAQGVYDTACDSGQNTDNVVSAFGAVGISIVDSCGGAPPVDYVHVGDLDGHSAPAGRNRWNATVTITVHDAGENEMSGVEVTGNWSGGTTGASSCITNGGGQCTVTSANMNGKQSGSVDFTVTGMSGGSGYAYDEGPNHDPDGDSDGTSITVTE